MKQVILNGEQLLKCGEKNASDKREFYGNATTRHEKYRDRKAERCSSMQQKCLTRLSVQLLVVMRRRDKNMSKI